MGDHRLLKRIMSGELENVRQRRPGRYGKEWTGCVVDDRRASDITVCEGGAGLRSRAWEKRKMRPKIDLRKRKVEEADKVEVAPGTTVGSFEDLSAAGWTHRPKESRSGVGCTVKEA